MTTVSNQQTAQGAPSLADNPGRLVLKDLFGAEEPFSDSTQHREAELSFQSYYKSRCQEFLLDGQNDVCVRTRADIKNITGMILSDSTREDILSHLKGWNGNSIEDHTASTTLDFCASLLIMTEVGSQDFRVSKRQHVVWKNGTLRQRLNSHFLEDTVGKAVTNRRMGKVFTAKNIDRIGGIGIQLTDNLADHLKLVDGDKTVFVFHNANFLKFQESLKAPLLPTELIRETLNTLALLFPQNDPETRKWVNAMGRIDPSVVKCGYLDVQERQSRAFPIWQERLETLTQAFDDAQPQTLHQWFWDRRNRVQWYTFWVALLVFILTLLFGIIQCIEGGVQSYYAVLDHRHAGRDIDSAVGNV